MILCNNCKTIIMTGKLCQNCINIEEKLYKTVHHNYYVRCPHCAHVFDVAKTADYIFGNHEQYTIVCQKCENNFEINSRPVQK